MRVGQHHRGRLTYTGGSRRRRDHPERDRADHDAAARGGLRPDRRPLPDRDGVVRLPPPRQLRCAKPEAPNPLFSTLNLQPSTLNPLPETRDQKP